jgi:hypothetical protein
MKRFASFAEALKWAKTYASEYCLPFHRWKVERVESAYAVAVVSVNSGAREFYITA